jgi:hypothetical protein
MSSLVMAAFVLTLTHPIVSGLARSFQCFAVLAPPVGRMSSNLGRVVNRDTSGWPSADDRANSADLRIGRVPACVQQFKFIF